MKITHWRDPQGKFAKKARQAGNVKIVILLVVIAIIGILGYKSGWKMLEPVQLDETKTEQVSSNDEGLTAEQKANLEKQYELAKQETALENKKAKLDADYKSQSDALETQLEAVRAQQTSFK